MSDRFDENCPKEFLVEADSRVGLLVLPPMTKPTSVSHLHLSTSTARLKRQGAGKASGRDTSVLDPALRLYWIPWPTFSAGGSSQSGKSRVRVCECERECASTVPETTPTKSAPVFPELNHSGILVSRSRQQTFRRLACEV